MVESHSLLVKSYFLLIKTHFLLIKSHFLLIKSQLLLINSQLLLINSRFLALFQVYQVQQALAKITSDTPSTTWRSQPDLQAILWIQHGGNMGCFEQSDAGCA